MRAGDMMTEEEILKLQQNTQQTNVDAVTRPSRVLQRLQKRRGGK